MVKIGNFLFHFRNGLFPVFYAALFIPSTDIFPMHWAIILGGFIILSGILTRSITIGLVYIVRGGKNRTIYANELVTDGIYQVCRNPMYLGNILLLLGFGIFANSLIFLLVFFPLFLFFYYAIIKAEEHFLSNQFGNQYVAYKERTNALLPNFSRVATAFHGRSLDIKKIIKKEYNSLFLYFTGVLLLLLYQRAISFTTFIIYYLVLLVLFVIVRILKKKKRL